MRGEQDTSLLGKSVLSHIVPFLNAQMGAFYCLMSDNTLKRVSSYAYSKTENSEKTIALGEGLVGQAALEKRPIIIENLPSNYFGKISSDLGGAIPRSLLLAPLFYEGEVNGVIELASFAEFTEHQKTFLEHVSENIGIALNTSNSRKKLQELLENSQVLTEKLQAQQEELKAVNEDLEEQSRALQEIQTELTSQQSELEQTNEQLEVQRDILNEKNEALNKAQILLEERSDEVQRASQYKSEFLANMSHELRTPLNSSLILAKLLSDNANGNLNAEQIKYAVSIHSAGNDLLNLINDILDLSKVEAGKLEIKSENVYITKVISNLKNTFDPLASEKQLKFLIQNDSSMPESFFTDHQRMEQILKNLLSNAFKFTEIGQVTLLMSKRPDGKLSMSVIDTGIGIQKAQQEVIFEAFRQADGTTNRKYGGSGLGLSISRDLARLLGGSVEVESVPGQGSRFTLLLPEIYDESHVQIGTPKIYSSSLTTAFESKKLSEILKQQVLIKPVLFSDDRDIFKVPRKSSEQSSEQRPERLILVIEDEPTFAKILFDLAHELNYKCLVAMDAEEGLLLSKIHFPDAILLDIKLPEHSGLTVLDQLKENSLTRHIPVHIISAFDYIEKALQMGALGYILKPVKRQQLMDVFAKIESKLTQKIKRILIVEDDKLQRETMTKLLSDTDIEITAVEFGSDAIDALKKNIYDCFVVDLKLPDMTGLQLLKKMTELNELTIIPPVIIYTGRSLTHYEENQLRKYSHSIIIKGAHSPERLLDEVSLFLHHIEAKLPIESQQMLKTARRLESHLQGRNILLVDDDVRNVFALSAALEQKGVHIVVARTGKEALMKLKENPSLDLVLMDIMMPEMDGYQAMREIRKQKYFQNLPIIAITASATKNDRILCIEAGANDYLSKPIDLKNLFSLIRVWAPKLGRD